MSALTQPASSENQINNIYLTSRIRMGSEVRLKSNGKVLNALITWYSFILIALSVADISKILEFKYFSTFSVACSVGILVASLLLQGARYQERAERFRECYLKLQSLHSSPDIGLDEKLKDYHAILNNYENHSDFDYQVALVSAWWNNKYLENSREKLNAGFSNISYVVSMKVVSVSIWVGLFSLPILLLNYIR